MTSVARRTHLFAAVGAVVVVALVASGCGGGGTPAAEQWAGDLCTSIATWRTEIDTLSKQAADALTKPATARPALEAAVDDGLAATQTLIDDLEALGPPDVPEGTQAKRELDAFLTAVEQMEADVKQALSDLPATASLADAVQSLSTVGAQLQATIAQGQELVTTLSGLGGELESGFENADSCQQLRSGG